MIFEVVLTQKANETFDAIRSQVASRWGEASAAKFEERTWQVLEIISKYPLIYQSTEYDKTIRKAHIHKNCSLFYNIRDNKIIVAFFWDNRQEPIF